MEIKWLEDFLNVATTRSFSRAAESRNITQSAFSRRIRGLEVWLGADLFDRSTYPITLTAEGRQFRETAEEVVRLLSLSRAEITSRTPTPNVPVVAVTALHTLCLTFLPQWLNEVRLSVGPVVSRVLPDNFLTCVQALVEGGYDFLLTFHHPSIPIPLHPDKFPHIVVGQDHLVAVAVPALGRLLVSKDTPLPLLQYSRGSFLGLLASIAQSQPGAPPTYVAHTNENSMAEALKFMALEGHGIAWLPESLVAQELADGQLHSIAPALPMDIRLYRSGERSRPIVDKIWRALESP